MNIVDVLERQAGLQSDAPALRLLNGWVSYKTLLSWVEQTSDYLAASGVSSGDVITHVFQEELPLLVCMLATARLGATVFNMPLKTPALRQQEMSQSVGALITITDVKGVSVFGTRTVDIHLPTLLRDISVLIHSSKVVMPSAPWVIAIGSGSTGDPKLMPISHRQQIARMKAGLSWLPYPPKSVVASMVSLDFSIAKLRFLEVMALGGCFVLANQSGVSPLDWGRQFAVNVLYGSVFHLEQLIRLQQAADSSELLNLDALMVGGSKVSTVLREKIQAHLCRNLYVLYGANEVGTAFRTYMEDDALIDSVGRPHAGFEVQVVDAQHQVLGPEQVGLIRIKSETGIDGYLGNQQATDHFFKEGWFYPGDLGAFSKDGQLVHYGRSDDLMIMNGINIYPAEIERALFNHPYVHDVVAFPVKHEVHGDVPVCVVVLKTGGFMSEEELQRFTESRLGVSSPKRVFVADAIPRNEQGKPIKTELNRLLAKLQPNRPPKVVCRQLMKQIDLSFDLAGEVSFDLIDTWLINVFEISKSDLLRPLVNHQSVQASWLWRCLLLGRLLMQVARVPAFALPAITEFGPVQGRSNAWRAQVSFPLLDLMPLAAYELPLSCALRMAGWLNSHPVDAEHIRQFGEWAQQNVFVPVSRLFPAGKSTMPVLRSAYQSGIPFAHIGAGVFQLGWGAKAKYLDRSTTEFDSAIGAKLSQNKLVTAQLLRLSGLPSPDHQLVTDPQAALAVAQKLGWPVVVKPVDRDRGEGVSVDIQDWQGLQVAFDLAHKLSKNKQVLVEKQVKGVCHRLFIAKGQLLYAVKRMPMSVCGDGCRTIVQLVDAELTKQALLPSWSKSEIRPLDSLAFAAIAAAGYDQNSVPAMGVWVPLRRIESTEWGGVDEEVTQQIHPENLRVALEAATLFGLDVAGIDIISEDIAQPWHANAAIINEVNFAPLLGGAAISRSYIPAFLDRLVSDRGVMPVHVFVGGSAAWQQAESCWRLLVNTGAAAYLTNHEQTFLPVGEKLVLKAANLYQRVRALVLSRHVEALVMVVSTDEFVDSGLPLEWVAQCVFVDDHIALCHPRDHASALHRLNALKQLMQTWC